MQVQFAQWFESQRATRMELSEWSLIISSLARQRFNHSVGGTKDL